MSTTTLHQRKPNYHQYENMNQSYSAQRQQGSSRPSTFSNPTPSLTSSTLLKSNPTHHSKIYKLKVPFLYKILPTFLITTIQILFFPLLKLFSIQLKPYWVERYFILIGNYLYKFQPNSSKSIIGTGTGGGGNNMKLKGSPIDLKYINVTSSRLANNGTTVAHHEEEFEIPSIQNCSGYFTITSGGGSSSSGISKTNHYATSTQCEASTWVHTLHQARQECITASMGHSKIPICRKVEYVNIMGKKIVERKERIANLIRKRELNEIELMCVNGNGSGGGLPRGYFG